MRATVSWPALRGHMGEFAQTSGLSADGRRFRRLFAALQDVASYTDGYTDRRLLEVSWGRIAELLAADSAARRCCARDQCAAKAAAVQVAEHETASPRWWQAVRVAAAAIDAHYAALAAGPEGVLTDQLLE